MLKATSVDRMPARFPNRAAPIEKPKVSPIEGGATFPLDNRLRRALWRMTWCLLASWTPSMLNPWRRFLLRLFGASVADNCNVHGSVTVWLPGNLHMAECSSLGPRVNCYNVAPIALGARAIVSQDAHLCAASHNVDDPEFPLVATPITIGADAWIAAEAFVGPGVEVGEGAVLAARAVAVRDLEGWTVYAGNPAVPRRGRHRPNS